MRSIQRGLLKAVISVVTYPKLTLAIAGVVLAGCVALALGRLTISTNQNKLFSDKVSFFRDFIEFNKKFPESEAAYVVIEAGEAKRVPPVERWTALADRIAQRMKTMPRFVMSADQKVPLDQLGAQGILFDAPEQLQKNFQDIRQFVPLVQLWGEKAGLLTGLLGANPTQRFLGGLMTQTPDAQTAQFVAMLAGSWERTLEAGKAEIPNLAMLGASDPSRLGYYYVADESDPRRHLMLVRIYPTHNFKSLTAISETIEAIRGAVREEAGNFPDFKVGLTGRPVLEADEMRATDRDSKRAEVVALTVVFFGMAMMLRSFWLALAAEISLAVGIGWTFGWATLSLGELNLLSIVFLIALIGIGMDYLIQILAAYRREARRYVRQTAIWARVFRYVGPPIVTACMGAAGAFFVAILTDFRGAADLGIIAGGGLLLCLLSGYTVLPALLTLFPVKFKPVESLARYSSKPPKPLGKWRLLLPAVWIGLLIAGIPLMLQARFNPNLLELQAPNLESVQLVRKLQTWSAAVISKDLQMLRKVRDAVAQSPTVASTESILTAYDNYAWLKEHEGELPKIAWAKPEAVRTGDLPAIATLAGNLAIRFEQAKLPAQDAEPVVQSLRGMAAKIEAAPAEKRAAMAVSLSAWQEGFVEELRSMYSQFSPQPLDVGKLPVELRSHLVSAGGEFALYIYPKDDLWKQQNLDRFVSDVESRVASIPGAPPVTGIAGNIHHTTASIEGAFYKATAYALALILVLVLIDLRNIRQTLVAVSVLAFGLPMLIALMGWLDISWNFANFFGLPILIGAGHEYGVFMMHRYKEVLHNPRRVWRIWDVADRALLLCAFVTSSSFGFFWALGHHEGLRSLGLVMALGSACIYLATIMVVRPLLIWRLEHKQVYENGAGVNPEETKARRNRKR